jgi:hypothetical protein
MPKLKCFIRWLIKVVLWADSSMSA